MGKGNVDDSIQPQLDKKARIYSKYLAYLKKDAERTQAKYELFEEFTNFDELQMLNGAVEVGVLDGPRTTRTNPTGEWRTTKVVTGEMQDRMEAEQYGEASEDNEDVDIKEGYTPCPICKKHIENEYYQEHIESHDGSGGEDEQPKRHHQGKGLIGRLKDGLGFQ